MKELETMLPEELRQHIEECQNLLHYKENERWYKLVGDISSMAQTMLNEYPNAKFIYTACSGAVIEIDMNHLTYEDNYTK